MKKYKVTLTADERRSLQELIAAGKAAAQKLAHARILLKADAAPGGPAWTDDRIADAVEVSTDTVARVRQRFVEDGLDAALDRKKASRPPVPPTLDGRAEARLIALACSDPPDGRARWTMQLLADKLVELAVDPGGPRRVAGGVGADATTYTVTIDPVRAVDPATHEEATERPEVPEAVAAARAACETDLRAAPEAPPPPPAFRDVRIERPFDAYLTASPLLMELGGAAVVDAGGGETLLVGVAKVVLTDGSADDVLRAERVCTLKARAAAVGERDGVHISYLKTVEDRVVVVADAAGERARSVSDRLTVTRESIEGVAKGLPVVGRWRSADGTVFYLAVGGRLTGPPRAKEK